MNTALARVTWAAPDPSSLPQGTDRLAFREMSLSDVPDLMRIRGAEGAMRFHPATRSAAEMADFLNRMNRMYRADGIGLWIVMDRRGAFVGDCGLAWQRPNGRTVLEVGYHVLPVLRGGGIATEAARSCVEPARHWFAPTVLTAIIHPDNAASRRVSEKLGMSHTEDDHGHDWIVRT